MSIKWMAPPHRSTFGPVPGKKWESILAPLRERPGEWAVVLTGPVKNIRAQAGNLRRGGRVVCPPGFEFTTRTIDGEGHLFARFIGGES